MLALETSVVIRLLIGEPAEQAAAAQRRLEQAVDDGIDVLLTDLAVAEAYHALQYHYDVPKHEAREMLSALLTSGVVEPEPAGLAGVLVASRTGAGMVDRLIHHRHTARSATTLTFDGRQVRLEGAERP